MKELKAKIRHIEDETSRIARIDRLIDYVEASHLDAVATFSNCGDVSRNEAVKIDKSIMIQMLAEQKLTIELELENDIKFITAIELLASTPVTVKSVDINAPQQVPAPMAPSPFK